MCAEQALAVVGSEGTVNGEAIDGHFHVRPARRERRPRRPGADGAVGTRPDEASPPAEPAGRERGYHLEIFFICFASLLLEISYTRIVSFKLFYYYTYLVIGLALLGIGCGSVVTAISPRLKRAKTDTIIMLGCLVGAVSVIVGYLIVARLPIASLAIWDYGTGDSLWNLAMLVVICLALFASFVWVGVMISTLFGRKTEGIGKLYFADLVGAGLACVSSSRSSRPSARPAPSRWPAPSSPPWAWWWRCGCGRAWRRWAACWSPAWRACCSRACCPTCAPTTTRPTWRGPTSQWSPIFRVDTANLPNGLLLNHDGLLGSVIKPWDGDVASLGDDLYNFDGDPAPTPSPCSTTRPSG